MTWRRRVALGLLLLLLPGCWEADGTLRPLTEGDGFSQFIQRTFSPKKYWGEKVAKLDEEWKSERARYKDISDKLRQVNQARRTALAEVKTDGLTGKERRAARTQVMDLFRQQSRDLRDELRNQRRKRDLLEEHLKLARKALQLAD